MLTWDVVAEESDVNIRYLCSEDAALFIHVWLLLCIVVCLSLALA